MKIILPNENNRVVAEEFPDETTDQELREFLGGLAPQYAQALIQRTTTPEGVEVRVTPRAGQKGSVTAVAAALLAAPETIPEVLLLAWELQEHPDAWPLERRLLAHQAIGAIIEAASAQRKGQDDLRRRLLALPPAASQEPPLGF